MTDTITDALNSGALWGTFCDELKAVGQQVLAADNPDDPLTRAEGFRYLTRLLRLSLEKNLEFSNPEYPQFYSLSHETAKIGNDNPDNFYQNCAVDGRLDYLIRGSVNGVDYLSIETKAGSFARGGDMAPTGHVEMADLERAADGSFELLVSAQQQAGNWLPMTAASDSIIVRQTFRDRNAEKKAELSIECLNPSGDDTLSPEVFARQLQKVVPFVSGTASVFRHWMVQFASHINSLPPNDQAMCLRTGGDPAIFYHNSYWRLDSDEALIIEFRPPADCRTWNFQLSNYWMESLDYRHRRIHINRHGATLEADGTCRLVVAHECPGPQYPNWLSTAGHRCGSMLLRYVEATEFPPIATRVVPQATLKHA